MWKQLISEIYPDAEFAAGAAAADLAAAGPRLGQVVPGELLDLLGEADGVRGSWSQAVIWPVARIVQDNLDFRSYPDFAQLYAPFDSLLFFGDNTGGDQFAFVPGDPAQGIVVWEHETDERRTVAGGLADYLSRILTSVGDAWYQD